MTPCCLVVFHQLFKDTYYILLQGCYSENCLHYIGKYLVRRRRGVNDWQSFMEDSEDLNARIFREVQEK